MALDLAQDPLDYKPMLGGPPSLSNHISYKQTSICSFLNRDQCRCLDSFRFLDLPCEIRLMVYRELFCESILEVSSRSESPDPEPYVGGTRKETSKPDSFPQLLSVSKGVRSEALPIFYSSVSLYLGILFQRKQLEAVPHNLLQNTTRLFLHPDIYCTQIVVARFPNLWELRICVPLGHGPVLYPYVVDFSTEPSNDLLVQRSLQVVYSFLTWQLNYNTYSQGVPRYRIILEIDFLDVGFRGRSLWQPTKEWYHMICTIDVAKFKVMRRYEKSVVAACSQAQRRLLRRPWWTQHGDYLSYINDVEAHMRMLEPPDGIWQYVYGGIMQWSMPCPLPARQILIGDS